MREGTKNQGAGAGLGVLIDLADNRCRLRQIAQTTTASRSYSRSW
jgi:hypothetical protein